MSSILFVIAALSGCPVTKMVDWTHGEWTPRDNQSYTMAVEGCKKHFGESAPCLKKFIKKEEGTYYAICGTKSSKQLSSSGTSDSYWFTLVVLKSQNGGVGTSEGTSNKESGCGRTCPTR